MKSSQDRKISYIEHELYLQCLLWHKYRKIVVCRGKVWGGTDKSAGPVFANGRGWYWMDALDVEFFKKYWVNREPWINRACMFVMIWWYYG